MRAFAKLVEAQWGPNTPMAGVRVGPDGTTVGSQPCAEYHVYVYGPADDPKWRGVVQTVADWLRSEGTGRSAVVFRCPSSSIAADGAFYIPSEGDVVESVRVAPKRVGGPSVP